MEFKGRLGTTASLHPDQIESALAIPEDDFTRKFMEVSLERFS